MVRSVIVIRVTPEYCKHAKLARINEPRLSWNVFPNEFEIFQALFQMKRLIPNTVLKRYKISLNQGLFHSFKFTICIPVYL